MVYILYKCVYGLYGKASKHEEISVSQRGPRMEVALQDGIIALEGKSHVIITFFDRATPPNVLVRLFSLKESRCIRVYRIG